MANMNLAAISGNLTRDPEVRNTASGIAVANLSVACNRPNKKVGDEWVEQDADFFEVVVWKGRAELCGRKLSKGSPVVVKGRLQLQRWEAQDGGKRSKVVIVAENIESSHFFTESDTPAGRSSDSDSFVPSAAADDDIPF